MDAVVRRSKFDVQRSAFAELESALQSDDSTSADEAPPPGFKPSIAWAADWKCSPSHAMAKLARMEAAGEMERRVYRIQKRHRIYPVPHYREIKRNARRQA